MPTVGDILARLRLDATEFQKGINSASVSLKRFGEEAQGLGKALTIGITGPLSLVAGASVKFASSFETTMTRVVTLSGVAEGQMQDFGRAILGLAPAIGRTPQDLAEGLFFVTSTGFRGAEALQILETSAKSAAIGMGTTAEVARALVSVLQAYGPANLTAARAGDILAAAVREGAAEASEFAPVLGRVVGLAALLGVKFEEVAAFLATFTRLGVNVDEAGTALRGILSSLVAPADDARHALAEIGLSVDILRRKIKTEGLTAVLLELVKLFEGDVISLDRLIPNIRALAGVLGTAAVQGDAYVEILKTIQQSTDLVETAHRRTAQTTAHTWETLMAQVQSVGIQFGETLLPATKQVLEVFNVLAQSVQTVVREFSALPEPIQRLALTSGLAAAAMGPLIFALGAFVTQVGSAIPFLGRLVVYLGPTGLLIGGATAFASALGLTVLRLQAFTDASLRALGRSVALANEFDRLNQATPGAGTFLAGLQKQIDQTIDPVKRRELQKTFDSIKQGIETGVEPAPLITGLTKQLREELQRMGDQTSPAQQAISRVNRALTLALAEIDLREKIFPKEQFDPAMARMDALRDAVEKLFIDLNALSAEGIDPAFLTVLAAFRDQMQAAQRATEAFGRERGASELLRELPFELEAVRSEAEVFGQSLAQDEERLNMLQSAIQRLLRFRIPPGSLVIRQYRQEFEDLDRSIRRQTAAQELGSIFADLALSLGISAQSLALAMQIPNNEMRESGDLMRQLQNDSNALEQALARLSARRVFDPAMAEDTARAIEGLSQRWLDLQGNIKATADAEAKRQMIRDLAIDIEQLEGELALVHLSVREREREVEVLQRVLALKRQGAVVTEGDEARIRSAIARIQGLRRELELARDPLKEFAEANTSLWVGFKDSALQALTDTEEALVKFFQTGKLGFKELVASIETDMQRLLTRQLITKPLAGLFSQFLEGLGGAGGGSSAVQGLGAGLRGLFSGAGASGGTGAGAGAIVLEGLQGGGVVRRHGIFELAEAGPELVVPLQGRVGQILRERVGEGRPRPIVNMFIQTPDATSFRASESQILGRLSLALKRVQDREL